LANDLRFQDPQQRVIVEKIVSDAVYFGKLGKLNEYASIQLSPDTCRNDYHPGPGYLQSPASTQISSVLPVTLPSHTALLLRLSSGIISCNSIKLIKITHITASTF
jgi:hypothetical protein